MDVNRKESCDKWYLFLFNCLGELINCCEDPELICDEIELACLKWGHAVAEEVRREDLTGLEGAVKAKQESRGEARQKLAVVLAWRLSNVSVLDKDKSKRDPQPIRGWVDPKALIGKELTQIEACRLLRRRRCRCKESCRQINFSREWDKIKHAQQNLLSKPEEKGE